MGLCGGKEMSAAQQRRAEELRAQDRLVAKALAGAKTEDQLTCKLLLLGAGSSGKSTIFKQLQLLYADGFPEAQCRSYVRTIANNVITSIQTLVAEAEFRELPLDPANTESLQVVAHLASGDMLTPEIGQHLERVWKDPAIQHVMGISSQFQLEEAAEYFFAEGQIARICAPGYLPTVADVLRSRVPTTGIVESGFSIDGADFRLFDVGGQRSERKKWIHCFANVHAVLFVVAVSAYDQNLYEDEATNRMRESLALFESTVNSEWFENSTVILLLNKIDLLQQKLPKSPLKATFPEYEGDNSFNDVLDWIQDLFLAQNRTHREIQVFRTSAIDVRSAAAALDSIKDIVIKAHLKTMDNLM